MLCNKLSKFDPSLPFCLAWRDIRAQALWRPSSYPVTSLSYTKVPESSRPFPQERIGRLYAVQLQGHHSCLKRLDHIHGTGGRKNRAWNSSPINISMNYLATAFFFFEGRRESIPFIKFSKPRGSLIWSSKRDGCQTSVLNKAGKHHICIDYRLFSECWHIYELWVASLFFY